MGFQSSKQFFYNEFTFDEIPIFCNSDGKKSIMYKIFNLS